MGLDGLDFGACSTVRNANVLRRPPPVLAESSYSPNASRGIRASPNPPGMAADVKRATPNFMVGKLETEVLLLAALATVGYGSRPEC